MDSKLLSLQVGLPKKYTAPQGEWVSGIWKHPVEGAIYASRTGLTGDGQGDLSVHGGLDKAIYVYPESHYSYWYQDLSQPDLPYGAFGENFTMTGYTEGTVCIGDVFRVGTTVTVEVSEPRYPCWKLARRLDVKDIVVRVNTTGFTGWYFRVLEEGDVAAEMDITLLERPYPQWTVTIANQAIHYTTDYIEEAHGLIACPALAESWRKALRYQLENQSSK